MDIGNMVENRADFGHILAKFNENGKETGSGSPNSDTVRGKPLGTNFKIINTIYFVARIWNLHEPLI